MVADLGKRHLRERALRHDSYWTYRGAGRMAWLDKVAAHPDLRLVVWRPVDGPGPDVRTLKLDVCWRLPSGDWDLYLTEDLYVVSALDGGSPWRPGGWAPHVAARDIGAAYALSHAGQDLLSILRSHFNVGLPSELRVQQWLPTSSPAGDESEGYLHPQLLAGVTGGDVSARRLPAELEAMGFLVDPGFVRTNCINDVIRVIDRDGNAAFLKREENHEAIRAEILCGALWRTLGWQGLRSRSTVTNDGLVLVVPALGSPRISDRGSFQDHFGGRRPAENPSSLRAQRASTILRITLRDLGLRDDADALRFLVINAVWGNTDRHRNNVHLGWERDLSAPDGGWGHLLPVDHGRCFFNNLGAGAPDIAGRPAQAVTGQLANPHQLLRASVEFARRDPSSAAEVALLWLTRVQTALSGILDDSEWRDYHAEASAGLTRAIGLSDGIEQFLDDCAEVIAT